MHSLAVSGATGSVFVFAGQQQQQQPQHARRIPNAAVAGRRRRCRFRSSLASAQPLPAQTYTSDILKAAAVQAPSGAVVPGLAEEEVPNVVALKSVSSSTNAAAGSPPAEADAEQPPHAPLRSPTSPLINWLPRTRWPRGIPVVMGAHLLASGSVAPISVSKGPGIDVIPHQFQYQVTAEHEAAAAASSSSDLTANVSASVHGSPATLAAALVSALLEAASAAISKRGNFALAVSGGSVLDLLSQGLKGKAVDFSKWTVALADERLVSSDDADSNLRAARAALPALFSSANVVVPFTEVSGGTAGAATEFEGALRRLSPAVLPRSSRRGAKGKGDGEEDLPVFDAVVLGLGPDGHVASLFPNHPATAVDDGRWVVPVEQAPKNPPRRVSLSLPVLRAATEVFVAASGEGKASAVQRALEVQALPGAVPAQMVRPLPSSPSDDGSSSSSRVRWMVDADAGSSLRPQTWEDGKAWPRSAV